MAADYPGTIKTFTTKTNKVDLVDAAHINDLQAEVVAIQTELGTDVAGSCTDLKTRLAVCLGDNGEIKKGTEFPGSPIEGQLFYRTDEDVSYIYDGAGWDALNVPVDGTITEAKMAAAAISQTILKTTTGEASTDTADGDVALPGGEYGFYPQTKVSSNGALAKIQIAGYGDIGTGIADSYVTRVGMTVNTGYVYAQQRYVTSSGMDLWVFLLIDKNTKKIRTAWQAPDHPSYGNGGDPDKMPHPFGSYNETLHEIILLDKATCDTLIKTSKETSRSILTIVNEDYEIDMVNEEKYQPLHTGKFIDKKPVMIDAIPDYIKVRRLTKK